MKFGVITFPGSNCDQDMISVLRNEMGQKVESIWHKETNLKGSDFIVLPGGFSYGDYLRSGAIARFSPIMEEVINHAKKGGYVLGICNGFQILIETGLLQGALLRNRNLKFISKDVYLKVINNDNKFCKNYKKNNIINLNIAHNEGNYFTQKDHLKELEDNALIPFKYCDKEGSINDTNNPNGSINNIAGILNNKKNILGMMPHPERMIDSLISNTDGIGLFNSILN